MDPVKLSVDQTSEIERFLLKTDESNLEDTNSTIHLVIGDVGSWVIKFRPFGVVVNNRAIVLPDSANINAQVHFNTQSLFWSVVNKLSIYEDEANNDEIRHAGSMEAIEMFKTKCLRISTEQSIPAAAPRTSPSKGTSNIAFGNYDPYLVDNFGQELKSGWMYKKRELLAGWRCRYFKVCVGRVEYFADNKKASKPRGIISLVGAEVHPAKRISVHGMAEYWGIVVETEGKTKTFRLASEVTGVDGMIEAKTWEKVFAMASIGSRGPGSGNNKDLLSPYSKIGQGRPRPSSDDALINAAHTIESQGRTKDIPAFLSKFLPPFTLASTNGYAVLLIGLLSVVYFYVASYPLHTTATEA